MKYTYQVSGTASQGQTWEVIGSVTTENLGNFFVLPERVMKEAFEKLTLYGKPGVGPYRITRLVIEEKSDEDHSIPGLGNPQTEDLP